MFPHSAKILKLLSYEELVMKSFYDQRDTILEVNNKNIRAYLTNTSNVNYKLDLKEILLWTKS